jgi:hypothetical protein
MFLSFFISKNISHLLLVAHIGVNLAFTVLVIQLRNLSQISHITNPLKRDSRKLLPQQLLIPIILLITDKQYKPTPPGHLPNHNISRHPLNNRINFAPLGVVDHDDGVCLFVL